MTKVRINKKDLIREAQKYLKNGGVASMEIWLPAFIQLEGEVVNEVDLCYGEPCKHDGTNKRCALKFAIHVEEKCEQCGQPITQHDKNYCKTPIIEELKPYTSTPASEHNFPFEATDAINSLIRAVNLLRK